MRTLAPLAAGYFAQVLQRVPAIGAAFVALMFGVFLKTRMQNLRAMAKARKQDKSTASPTSTEPQGVSKPVTHPWPFGVDGPEETITVGFPPPFRPGSNDRHTPSDSREPTSTEGVSVDL